MSDAPERFTEGAIVGHFRLERMIGRGGMGVVWSAVDLRDASEQKRVALKFLIDVRTNDPVSHARFLREADTASKLKHPNVVRVHAIDYVLDGTPYLVMELLEGESLRARMKLAQRLSPRDCGVLLGPVASVACAAHEAGIVHRDLKPENVFLSSQGVRVLDFGIAKRVDPSEADTFTSTGAMLGTPAYMAPEQIFGDRTIDGKADVWALGVILYECLSGVRPAEGGVGQILKAVTSGSIVPLHKLVPAPALAGTCRFIMTMLAATPSDRPSMADVDRMLAGLRDDTGRSEVSPGVAYSGTVRGRGRAGLVAAAAIAFVLGFAGIYRFERAHRSVASVASVGATKSEPTASITPDVVLSTPMIAEPTASAPPTSSAKAVSSTHAAPSARAVQERDAPSAPARPFDVALQRVRGMGTRSTQSDVVTALEAMKPCLPAPTADERWAVMVDATWPKGGARTEMFEAQRNSVGVKNAQGAAIEACAKKTFDAATIAVPDGQDEAGGTSYVRMSVGY